MKFIIFLTKSSSSIILTIICFMLLNILISFINFDWDTGWISMTIIYFFSSTLALILGEKFREKFCSELPKKKFIIGAGGGCILLHSLIAVTNSNSFYYYIPIISIVLAMLIAIKSKPFPF